MNNRQLISRWEQGDLFSGEFLRDAGIALVTSHNELWMDLCIKEAQNFVLTRESFTGEDIRFHLQKRVGYPRHANAWGALINRLIRLRVITPTGRYRPMRDDNSHARSTPVYEGAG